LVEGLLANGLAGPLRELYYEETTDNPAEALSERYERLLDAPINAGQLADLIEGRFQAAVRLKRWDVLEADLAKLRPRFGLGEEQLWLRLLFSLADRLAWETDSAGARLLSICHEEFVRYEHLASNMSPYFDRFDLLLQASTEWRALTRQKGFLGTIWRLANTHTDDLFKSLPRRVPVAILRLIAESWSRPLAEVRESLTSILEVMAASPQQWLKHLDTMRQRAPATLALFGELLDRFETTREGESERHDGDIPTGLVLAFLARTHASNYEKERGRLLLFCVRENLAPEEIAKVASGWSQALTNDWPLRYVCRACRLFWA
jgi:hypothetical protein